MTHGGKRVGAGRPRIEIDDGRVIRMRGWGWSISAIAAQVGVSHTVIKGVLKDHFDKPKGNT